MKNVIVAAMLVIAIVGGASLAFVSIPAQQGNKTQTVTTSTTRTVSEVSTKTLTSYSTATLRLTTTSEANPGLLNFIVVITCPGCTNSSSFPDYYSAVILNGTQGHKNVTSPSGDSTAAVSYSFVVHPGDYLGGNWSLSWSVLLYSQTGLVEVNVFQGPLLFWDKSANPGVGFVQGTVTIDVS